MPQWFKVLYYREQDAEKVKAYQKEIAGIAPEQIAYVDETGIDTYLYREYGYALKGQKVNAAIIAAIKNIASSRAWWYNRDRR